MALSFGGQKELNSFRLLRTRTCDRISTHNIRLLSYKQHDVMMYVNGVSLDECIEQWLTDW
jgi:hypothetical protein